MAANSTIRGKYFSVNTNFLYSNRRILGYGWEIWTQDYNLFFIVPTHALHYNLTLRVLMSYIYGAPILDVSRSHTTTQHSR